LLFIVIIVVTYHTRNYIVRKPFYEKGIYEIENTFTPVAEYNSLRTIYMICLPPSDEDELISLVKNYIKQNNVVQMMKNRIPEFYGNYIMLVFVEPSKDYPVGWNRGDSGGFFSIDIDHYSIININIPWNSKDDTDWNIYVR